MVKVVVANRLERGGKTYKGGDIVDVTPGEARDLIGSSKARADDTPVKAEPKGAKNG